jgi:hypothetical protein
MENVDKIYGGYGDKPDQGKLHSEGESYVKASFPKLDWIKKCYVLNHEGVAKLDNENQKDLSLKRH